MSNTGKILKILSYSWLIFFVYLGIVFYRDEIPKQIEKNKKQRQQHFEPIVNYINNYKTKSGKFPTQEEFYWWGRDFFNDVHFYSEFYPLIEFKGIDEIEEIPKGLDKKNEFVIVRWRGDWKEYYTSWDNHYSLDNMNDSDRTEHLLVFSTIGILPVLVLGLISLRKTKHNHT